MKPVVYCHFSFRRPKGKEYGIFACALYKDFDGKILVARHTRVYKLWEDHQHITAIQAYANALNCICEWQNKVIEYNIHRVMLVTDNSNLTNWIEHPRKNKMFRPYMEKAYEQFHNGSKELKLDIGVCDPRKAEKSYKFCKEELVENFESLENKTHLGKTKLKLTGLISIDDVLNEDKPLGIESFKPVEKV